MATKAKSEQNAKRRVDDYLSLPYRVEIYPDETKDGPYWATRFPELPGVAGSGNSLEEAVSVAKESLRYWLEAKIDGGHPIPEPSPRAEDAYSGKLNIRLPKALHRDLTKRAENEGVSLNTWMTTILAKYGA